MSAGERAFDQRCLTGDDLHTLIVAEIDRCGGTPAPISFTAIAGACSSGSYFAGFADGEAAASAGSFNLGRSALAAAVCGFSGFLCPFAGTVADFVIDFFASEQ